MTNTQKIIYWLPRVLSIGFVLFISIFAFDVFGQGAWWEQAGGLLIHLMPSFVMLAIIIVFWKRNFLWAIGLIVLLFGLLALPPIFREEDRAVESGEVAGWQTVTANGVTFRYPEDLKAEYISTQTWPPEIKVAINGQFKCEETPATSSASSPTSKRTVDDRVYCVSVESDAAAGTMYSTYAYSTLRDNNLISASFTLRFPECLNYADQNLQAECAAEREAFDLDALVDRIMATVRL